MYFDFTLIEDQFVPFLFPFAYETFQANLCNQMKLLKIY